MTEPTKDTSQPQMRYVEAWHCPEALLQEAKRELAVRVLMAKIGLEEGPGAVHKLAYQVLLRAGVLTHDQN